jgi:hypothetical protein
VTANERARADTSALAPGITLFERAVGDEVSAWTVRASAQIEGKQRIRSWGLTRVDRPLQDALREACEYRYQHAPGAFDSVGEMYRACVDALEKETLEELREAGVDVRGLEP